MVWSKEFRIIWRGNDTWVILKGRSVQNCLWKKIRNIQWLDQIIINSRLLSNIWRRIGYGQDLSHYDNLEAQFINFTKLVTPVNFNFPDIGKLLRLQMLQDTNLQTALLSKWVHVSWFSLHPWSLQHNLSILRTLCSKLNHI